MNKFKNHILFLGIVFSYLLFRHYYLFTTHFGFDDMHYARLSNDIACDKFVLSDDHYGYRWGFIFPVAFFYKLLGINDFSSGLYSMICMTAMVYGIWLLSSTWSWWMRILSVSFVLTYYWTGFYADKIMPDIPAAVAVFGAFYAHYRFKTTQNKPIINALFFIISLMMAFLIKEAIVIVLPVFMLWMIYDCYNAKTITSFWRYALPFGLVSIILYFGLCFLLTGSMFSRMEAIFANGYFSDCSYDQLPWSATWERITVGLTRIWLDTGLLVVLPFVLISLFSEKIESRYWSYTSVLLMLCANFMSTSLKHYVPLCPDIRHYMWIVPSLCISFGSFPKSSFKISVVNWSVFISLSLTLLAFFIKSEMLPAYILSSLALIVYRFKNKLNPMIIGFLTLTFLFFLYRSYRAIDKQNYTQQKELINKHFGSPPNIPTLVISNSAEVNIDRYLTAFKTENLTWAKQQDLKKIDVLSVQQVFYIQNGMTAYLSGLRWEDNPDWIKQGDFGTRVDSLNGVELFKVEKEKLLLKLE